MFPSQFRLTNNIDIVNYNKLKKSEDVVIKKNAIDTGIYAIDSEFSAFKNRQLQKKNMQKFIPDQKFSFNKTNISATAAKFNSSHSKKSVGNHAISKFYPNDGDGYQKQSLTKVTQSCNINRIMK
jgi:hypothetical protein